MNRYDAGGELLQRYEEIAEKMGDNFTMPQLFADVALVVGRVVKKIDANEILEREYEKAAKELWPAQKEIVEENIEKARPLLESPLEAALLPWLLTQNYRFFKKFPRVLTVGESHEMQDMDIAIVPQLPIGKFRADFAIAVKKYGCVWFVLVEADGKVAHDGVKNVMRDVERDVAILRQKRVLDMVRIESKDILKDARSAARQAEECLFNAWRSDNETTKRKIKG